jgi:hypothetical protein
MESTSLSIQIFIEGYKLSLAFREIWEHFDSHMVEIDGQISILPDFRLPPLGGDAVFGNPGIDANQDRDSAPG